MEKEEQERLQEEKEYAATLAREDATLDKIDDMIGSIVDQKEKEKGGKSSPHDELRKNDAVIADVVNTKEILEEEGELADELKQVFAETDKAQKRMKEEGKKNEKKKTGR